MRVTHLGHSTLLVEAGGVRLLIDPGAFTPGWEQLTGLDAVLVTHQHPDHVDVARLPALLDANDGVRLVVEPQTVAELAKAGVTAQPLEVGGVATFGEVTVTGIGGQHAVIHADIARIGNVGLLIQAGDGPRLFHPGDMIDTAPEGVDVLAMPIAAPWSAAKETVEFLRAVAPPTAFPIHDALLSGTGRTIFGRVIGGLAPDSTTIRDLSDAVPVDF
jgi:L-ascorbate metabolism protein UlaG (beta-lactamase superfamily)